MAPNCLEFLEIVCGVASAGCSCAMVTSKSTPSELARVCNDSEARVLFVHDSVEEVARSADLTTVEHVVVIGKTYETWLGTAKALKCRVPIEEWDPFLIPYTSGTTGGQKGVVLSHRARVLVFFAMASEYGCYSPDDRALVVSPLAHGGGFTFGMAPIFFGGFAEIMRAYDPERLLKSVTERRITNIFLVPTHFHALFALSERELAQHDTSSLAALISNSAPLPQATKERIVEHFGEGRLHETYGSTEAAMVTNLRPPDQLRKEHCVGLPFPCVEVELRQEDGRQAPAGELAQLFSRSPYHFSGYLNRPDETAAVATQGWISVGDIARRDDEGYIYIVDRKDDVIITGGVNVYPREVEEVLHHHRSVDDAAVFGMPDEYWGERVCAVVVVRRGATVSKHELLDYCSETLARYKIPKSVAFAEGLPRNAAGKVLRRNLKALHEHDMAVQAAQEHGWEERR